MNNIFKKIQVKLQPVKNILKETNDKPLILIIVSALVINMTVEMLSRRSIAAGLAYFIENPFIFIINAMIIFLTLSISLLFKRRLFVMALMSTVWVGLGVANYIILSHRNTPLGALDFKVLKSVLSILNVYLTPTQIVFIGAGAVAIITAIALTWKKVPKQKNQYVRSVSTFVTCTVIIVSVIGLSIKGQALATNFGNVVDAYDKYGFAYCFSSSVVASGISKPSDYSSSNISGILDAIEATQTNVPESTPNIIMLQLESFFDPNYLQDLTFSENPVPYFSSLKENYTSGFLTVPGVGAGTANTEFEVLSGMNLRFFGPGEYPYTTILKSKTCESINYNLKELGYTTHAIHNHTGTFYTRHEVYPQLGFDNFTPIECMGDIVRNPLGWAKDKMLTKEIMNVLYSTAEQDFVYAVSVQGHGKYPSEKIDDTQTITVGGLEDEGQTIAYEYYVNQLYEVDTFLEDLTTILEAYEEPVVLVMFGDHLPGIEIQYEDLSNGNIYQTEYVIWSNFPMEKTDKDLYTYQLSAFVLEKLDMNNGVLTKFHQKKSNEIEYQRELKLLQYDMLYGDMVSYGWYNPYPATDMNFGTYPPMIINISKSDKILYINGGEFNKWSRVYINDQQVSTKLIDQNTLLCSNAESKVGDIVTVRQIGKSSMIYNESPGYMIQK